MPEHAYGMAILRAQCAGLPDPPKTGKWTDWLRWSVAVMDIDDRSLCFAASLLSYSAKYGGLTAKQDACAREIVDRIYAAFRAGALNQQQAALAALDGGQE